jgi:urease subunit gamma/beta
MHLTPREIDKLTLHQAGVLAQKRLARGVRLNHPEAAYASSTGTATESPCGRSASSTADFAWVPRAMRS